MISERISKMRETILSLEKIERVIPTQDFEYSPDPSKSQVLRQAEAVKILFQNARINRLPDEKIAGNNTTKYSPRPDHLTNEDIEKINKFPEMVSEEILVAMEERLFYVWAFIQGHIVPDKELVLKKGMNHVIRTIEQRLEDDTLSVEQRDFLIAGLIECKAFLEYVNRHKLFYEELAEKTSVPDEKESYLEIARICGKVPAEPAGTFREALQSVWFAQIGTQFDDCANHSLGRMDQYLFPYFKSDIDAGRMTYEEGKELFYEFWLKFNLGYKKQELSGTKMGLRADDPEHKTVTEDNSFDIFDPHIGFSWLALKCISPTNHMDDGQTMDLGGLDEEGNDAVNDLSWVMLEAEGELRTFEPKTVIKYTDKTDEKFMDRAFEILSGGLGLPAITFHESGAKGLRKYNLFDEEDIRNHSHIGCIELGFPGKGYTDPMNAFINIPKIVLITMENGFYNGRKIGLELDKSETWEGFYRNFSKQLDYFINLYTKAMNTAAPFFAQYYSRPLVSVLIDGCIEKATPVDNGGSRYWVKAVNCTGFATAVDSLYSLKKIVFEEQNCSLNEFLEILKNNFENHKEFHATIKNKIPKFGNGNETVDKIANELTITYSEIVNSKKTFNGNPYRPGIYSFYEPIINMGHVTGATPDGRKTGEFLSLNSSPSHGGVIKADMSDTLRSIAAIEHSRTDNAGVVDVHLSNNTPPAIIRHIVEYMATKDILYAQFTVVDKKELEEAMVKPEQYQDLTVRVTGFSARFVALSEETQKEIAERSHWN